MAAVAAGLNIAPVLRLKRTKELLSQKTNAVKAELDKTLDSSKNFSNYKDMLKTINPPCVPFFGEPGHSALHLDTLTKGSGFWLSALTFIEDGNKDMVMPGSAFRGMTNSASSNSLASTSNGMTPMTSVSNSSTTPIDPQNTPLSGPQKPLINFFKRSLSAEILRDIQQYQSQPYNLAKCKVVHDWMIKQLEVCDKSYDLNKLYELSLQLEPREREEERITRMLHDSVSVSPSGDH
jgi:son of sevenless-like protein